MTPPKPTIYDRVLIISAVAIPLFLIMVVKWQASWDTWFVPSEQVDFGPNFERDIVEWLEAEGHTGFALTLIQDPDCPCTKPAQLALHNAMEYLGRSDVKLTSMPLSELERTGIAIPSTPLLIASKGPNLLYVGPVASGNFCTQQAKEILALSSINGNGQGQTLNSFAYGCFCPANTIGH